MQKICRRFLAALICALTVMGGAASAQPAQSAAWRVVVEDIRAERGEEDAPVDIALDALVGCVGDVYWAQLTVLQAGEAALVLQAQYDAAGETITVGAEGAQDCLVIDHADVFLKQYWVIEPGSLRGILEELLTLLEGAPDALLEGVEALQARASLDVFACEVLDDSAIRLEIKNADARAGFSLRCTPWEGGVPFDFSARNACRYTYREAFPGEGTDLAALVRQCREQIMQDESLSAAIGLFLAGTWIAPAGA